jgi:hypothetical protein
MDDLRGIDIVPMWDCLRKKLMQEVNAPVSVGHCHGKELSVFSPSPLPRVSFWIQREAHMYCYLKR